MKKLSGVVFIFSILFFNKIEAVQRLVCEGNQLNLRCPINQVIQISSSFYGRSDKEACQSESKERTSNEDCSYPQAFDVISSRCNNQSNCAIDVSTTTFPDPCPETYKYVQVDFRCVTYLFACPGSLVGIRSKHFLAAVFSPDSTASWSKDALFKPKRVYYHVDGEPTVKEYADEEVFVQGGHYITHDLLLGFLSSHFVVHNSFIYYYKPITRTIAKYSTKMKSRRIEAHVISDGTLQDIENVKLAVDEKDLWMTYYCATDGIVIHKLNLDDLQIEKSWKTGIEYQLRHTIFICGVMYAFNDGPTKKDSRDVVVFNTNNDQKSRYTLVDDRSGFLQHNISSLHYNPRDRILYAMSLGRAFYFRLDFSSDDPTKRGKETLTTTFNPIFSEPNYVKPSFRCESVEWKGLSWPETGAGTTTTVQCDDKTASWFCVKDKLTEVAQWSSTGPDVSGCLKSLKYLLRRVSDGDISAVSYLAELIETMGQSISEDQLKSIAIATRKITSLMLERQDEDQIKVVESIIEIVNLLIDEDHVMKIKHLNEIQRHQFVDDVLVSVDSLILGLSKEQEVFEKRMLNIVVIGRKYSDEVTFNENFYRQANISQEKQTTSSSAYLPAQNNKLSNADFSRIQFSLYSNLANCIENEKSKGSTGKVVWQPDSDIVSISISKSKRKVDLSYPVQVTFKHQQTRFGAHKRKCVYWNFSNGKTWKEDGCKLISSNETHSTCEFQHLTTFGLLVQNDIPSLVDDNKEQLLWFKSPTLSISMSVGISVAAFCLLLCFTTFIAFKNLQSDLNCMVKHFSITLFVSEITYMVAMHKPSNEIVCYVVALLLHFSLLATFIWLALETFQIYALLGDYAENPSTRWKWFYLIGYGVPFMIVMVSAFVNIHGYEGSSWCWLNVQSSSMLGFVLPLCVAITTSLIFLIITTVKLHRQSTVLADSSRLRTIKNGIRSSGSLLFLLGLTWMFGLVWMWERSLIIAYLFLFFNVFQGFFVFFVHCILQRKVRREYSDRLNGWSCCNRKTRMGELAYVSSSMSFSKHYTSPGNNRYKTAVPCSSNIAASSNQNQLRRMWSETLVNANGSSNGTNQSQSESAAILYKSENGPNRDHTASNYGPGRSTTAGYLEPQMMTGQQHQQKLEPQKERCHPSENHSGYCHNKPHSKSHSCDEGILEPLKHTCASNRENTYKYDRLDRHAPSSNSRLPDDMSADGHPARLYTNITNSDQLMHNCSCMHHHATSRQPRAYTMNHHVTTPSQSNQISDSVSHCHHGLTRPSTISKVGHQHHQWSPSDDYNQDQHENVDAVCIRPYQITPLTSITGNRRRTSMNSTEESDITNDMSTSSFENRPPPVRSAVAMQPKEHLRQMRSDRWTPVTSRGYDENDLEVERCLFPSARESKSGPYNGTERDSAFYQSMPDLNHQATPSSNICYGSSPSSGCSPEMASADDDMHHGFQGRRATDQTNLISNPPGEVRTANRINPQRRYEDIKLLNESDQQPIQHRPTYVLTASRLNRNDGFGQEDQMRSSGSHLQTCL